MATFTWTGAAGDGNFQNAANWSPRQGPGAGATVLIDPSAPVTIAVADTVANLTDNAGVTLTVAGYQTLQLGNGGTLATFSNGGTLVLDNPYGPGLLLDAGTTSLTGSGTIDIAGSVLQADAATQTLVNQDTIAGYGYLGNGTLTLSNGAAGVIDANVAGAVLGVNTGTATLANAGLLEATGGGDLQVDCSVTNTGTGAIVADGGTVTLTGGIVSGGTLSASGGGFFADDGTLTLNGRAAGLTIDANLVVADYAELSLVGTIVNAGVVSQAYVHGNGIVIGPASGSGTAVLAGAGTLALQSGIQAAAAGDVLDNRDNTISGFGTLGGGTDLAIINAAGGVIDATGAMTLATGTATVTNAGLITASAGGALTIGSTVNNGASGRITAAGGTVTLAGADIAGGTLGGSAGGYFLADTGGGASTVLDGTANPLTIAATIDVPDGGGLMLAGAIVNNGAIIPAYVSGPEIVVAAGTTFTNNGTLAAGAGGLAFGTGTVLTNDRAAAGLGTLTGGTFQALGGTLSFAGAAVGTLAGGTVLDVGDGGIAFGGSDVLASLTRISAGADVAVASESDAGTQTLTSAGTLSLDAATYGLAALVNAAGGTLSGNGDLAATLRNSGTIDAAGGELDLVGATSAIGGTVTGGAGDFVGFGGTATLLGTAVVSATDLAVLNGATLRLGAKLRFAGTFDIRGNATLAGSAALTSSGLFEQVGNGTGTIAAPVTSTGTIAIGQGGTLAFANLASSGVIVDEGGFTDANALKAGALTVGTSGYASVGGKAGAANSVLRTLVLQGGSLTTNATTLTVTGDYDNTASGTGNGYTPFAGVSGTIDGTAKLAVVGVDGTAITSVGGTETITLAAGQTAHFKISNAGAATSALLRGALETGVNGGSITGTALSGSGVTAGDFGPLAGGTASGVYAITYDGSAPLTGEAIHIASDFANVAGITIDIVSSSTTAAVPAGYAAAAPDLREEGLRLLLPRPG